MHAPARAGDTRADIAPRLLCKKGHDVPDKRSVPLFWHPWLEVIGGHDPVHASAFSGNGEVNDLLWPELLEHRRVADF